MTDFVTLTRLHDNRYSSPSPPPTQRTSYYSELYRQPAAKDFHSSGPRVDKNGLVCRSELVSRESVEGTWEAYDLSCQLDRTYDALTKPLSKKTRENTTNNNQHVTSERFLCEAGRRDPSGSISFQYPRGVCTDSDGGDIYVADTGNRVVKRMSRCGLYISELGGFKVPEKNPKLREPTGVSVQPRGVLVAVADRKNRSVEIFSKETSEQVSEFGTINEPYSVVWDYDDNIIVATTSQTVEIYSASGQLKNQFKVDRAPEKITSKGGKISAPIYMTTGDQKQILLSQPSMDSVSCYTYDGKMVYRFQPTYGGKEMLSFKPAGVAVDTRGGVVLADSLNGTVSVFDRDGIARERVVGGDPSGTPSLQNISLGPEGHLVTTEFAANGRHSVKIYKYRSCKCHPTKFYP